MNLERRAILVVPGTAFWVLVIVGAVTGNGMLIGVALAMMVLTFAAVGVSAYYRAKADKAARDEVWEHGTHAKATVVSIDDGGREREVDFVLDVSAFGLAMFRAKVTSFVSELAIPRIQPGEVIDVRFDPADQTRIVIDPALRPPRAR